MSNANQLELLVRVGFAAALGALVGAEREIRGHEAGMRTSALVCIGAALFGEVSVLFGDSRVAAGVVQGIGFLGAGLIFRAGHQVQNATTAVTMWVLAAIGLAIAASLPVAAIGVTAVLLVALESGPASGWLRRFGARRELTRDLESDADAVEEGGAEDEAGER
jgi:putative Mg2+ transporter-C (MgtC) family protein